MSQTQDDTPMQDAADVANASTSKALPAGIIPANKASTAASQDIIDRYAPGSAPHWVGVGPAARDGSSGSDKPKP